MKVITWGTTVKFFCKSCGSEFVVGINIVKTPDKGENYYSYCPVCGGECHADTNAIKRGNENAKP